MTITTSSCRASNPSSMLQAGWSTRLRFGTVARSSRTAPARAWTGIWPRAVPTWRWPNSSASGSATPTRVASRHRESAWLVSCSGGGARCAGQRRAVTCGLVVHQQQLTRCCDGRYDCEPARRPVDLVFVAESSADRPRMRWYRTRTRSCGELVLADIWPSGRDACRAGNPSSAPPGFSTFPARSPARCATGRRTAPEGCGDGVPRRT